jgi:dolichyl-phosphate beta-glucosyltransferase
MSTLFLSIVIPAYNEEKRIGASLSKVMDYMERKRLAYEFVIADDGCCDNTESVVKAVIGKRAPLNYLKGVSNRGKGNAVKRGMLAAQGDFALLTDADLSTPIEELDKFLPFMNSPEAVLIGNRKTRGALVRKHQAFIRENMGKVFTLLTNVILCMWQSDFTCGFKVFGRESRQRIFQVARIKRWGYDSELLFLARRFGYLLQDVPVVWDNSEATKVNLLLDTLRSFKELFEIRWNWVRGRY